MKKPFLKFISLVIATALLVTLCSCASGSVSSKRQFASKQSVSSQNSEVQSTQSIDSPSQVMQSQNNQSAQSNLQSNVQSASSIDSSLNITSSDIISSQLPNSSYINTSSQSGNNTSSNNNSLVNTTSRIVSTQQKEYVLPFKSGINIDNFVYGSWRLDNNFDLSNFASMLSNIKNQGFDHIRLPINFHTMYSARDKSLNENQMSTLDEVLNLIEADGFYVFIDFHDWWDMDYDNPNHLDEFVTIWELIAQRYKDRSELVYFELVNEPQIADINKLNSFLTPAIEAIRKTNPTRKIIFPAADANQTWVLDQLKLPVENDDNLILAIHLYSPPEFTHQGCEWAGQNKGQVRLTQEHKSTLDWDIKQIENFIRYNKYRNVPIILNEFGLNIDLADEGDASEFVRIITQFCKDNGIPWAWWQYVGGVFSLYEEGNFFSKGYWNQNALDALFLR